MQLHWLNFDVEVSLWKCGRFQADWLKYPCPSFGLRDGPRKVHGALSHAQVRCCGDVCPRRGGDDKDEVHHSACGPLDLERQVVFLGATCSWESPQKNAARSDDSL